MGKVLKNFTNGWEGAIARAADDIVISLPNKSNAAIDFGKPLALNSDRDGVIPFDGSTAGAHHLAADFLGVSVRNPSKTPDTYGSSTGSYAANDLVDVLVRGHIVVKCQNSNAKQGQAVSILISGNNAGKFTVATGDTVVALNNVHISGAPDTNGLAEILLNTRNIL